MRFAISALLLALVSAGGCATGGTTAPGDAVASESKVSVGWTVYGLAPGEKDYLATLMCPCLEEPIEMRPDEKGEVRAEGLPPGLYRVRIESRGRSQTYRFGYMTREASVSSRHQLARHSHVSFPETMRAERSEKIEGKLITRRGPLANLPITVRDYEGREVHLKTDAEGRFSVLGLAVPEGWNNEPSP